MDVTQKRQCLLMLSKTNYSNRRIASAIGISPTTVAKYRSEVREIDIDSIAELTNSEVKQLYINTTRVHSSMFQVDFNYVKKLKDSGLTLTKIHDMYELDAVRVGKIPYSYQRFCELYNQSKSPDSTMLLHHNPGETLQVDFAGKTISYIRNVDQVTENVAVQIFVAVLPYSLFAFVFAVPDQSSYSFQLAHKKLFEFLGGSTKTIIPDQLKAAVDNVNGMVRVNLNYKLIALHYRCVPVPARPYRPKDKALVENTVLHITRYITYVLRRQKFFSIEEVNLAIERLLIRFNSKIMHKYGISRWQKFVEEEKADLTPLPDIPYCCVAERRYKNIDTTYHVTVATNLYSVPHKLIGEEVMVTVGEGMVNIFYDGKLAARHQCASGRGKKVTKLEHMPKAHQVAMNISYEDLMQWAGDISHFAKRFMEAQFEATGPTDNVTVILRCQKIQNLCFKYGEEAFSQACQHAVEREQLTYVELKATLKHKLYNLESTIVTNSSLVGRPPIH
jgi:transposase/DNA-binding CsgD family transcriptional regulator